MFVWFLGHAVRDVCMAFDPCFKVCNLVPVHSKSIKLDQMTTLDMIFHVGVSVYQLVKLDLKLAPVPCAVSEWPFACCSHRCSKLTIRGIHLILVINMNAYREGRDLLKVGGVVLHFGPLIDSVLDLWHG